MPVILLEVTDLKPLLHGREKVGSSSRDPEDQIRRIFELHTKASREKDRFFPLYSSEVEMLLQHLGLFWATQH